MERGGEGPREESLGRVAPIEGETPAGERLVYSATPLELPEQLAIRADPLVPQADAALVRVDRRVQSRGTTEEHAMDEPQARVRRDLGDEALAGRKGLLPTALDERVCKIRRNSVE